MKIESAFCIVLFTAVLLSVPSTTIAQERQSAVKTAAPEQESGTKVNQPAEVLIVHPAEALQAGQDAAADVNEFFWFGGNFLLSSVGCCIFGTAGVLTAYLYKPPPPASRLLGKSPEYISLYLDTYQDAARFRRVVPATLGYLTGSVTCCVVTSIIGYNDIMNFIEDLL